MRYSKVLSGGGWYGERLNRFLKEVCYLGSPKCFTGFFLVEIFENSASFSISILLFIALQR